MLQGLSLSVKLTAICSLLLPLVMFLMRSMWPDIAWGFLLLFGLQVLLLLAALQLVLTSIWGPGRRWKLPKLPFNPQRPIFGQTKALMVRLRGLVHGAKRAVLATCRRLFTRKPL